MNVVSAVFAAVAALAALAAVYYARQTVIDASKQITADAIRQLLAQLERVSSLLLGIADAAREDCAYRPRPGSIGLHETWLPARLRHLGNSVAILEMVGGDIELPRSRALAGKSYPSGSDAKTLLEDALGALAEVHVVLGSEQESAPG